MITVNNEFNNQYYYCFIVISMLLYNIDQNTLQKYIKRNMLFIVSHSTVIIQINN